MIRSSGGRILVLLLVLIAAIALVVGAYHVGVSAGIATAGAGTSAIVPHAWGYGFAGGWGVPWFFIWPIFPVLFILFIALLLRAAFWGRGPWHHDAWSDERWMDGPGTRLAEWHRRAHEDPGSPAGPGDRQSGEGR